MASSFQKKTSRIFLTVFIGFIAISFMFTGYETSMGTPDTVARVGDIKISINDYQNEYNRQIEFYREMMGETLSSQQIESFGIRDSAVQGLIQRSLMVQFARTLGIHPGERAIADEIKELPYFQTGGRFDMERYRGLLSANGMTPSEFEEMIEKQLQTQMASNLLQAVPISNRYIKERDQFRKQRLKTSLVEIEKTALRSSLEVETSEVEEFLSDEMNMSQIEDLFLTRKPQLDQPEQALASHILIRQNDELTSADEVEEKLNDIMSRVNKSNFKELANEYTQDPSGRGNGGSLGWFSRGQMVPEFEDAAFSEPVGSIVGPIETQFGHHIIFVEDRQEHIEASLDEHKKDLAIELIRTKKNEELSDLMARLRTEIFDYLSNNQIDEVERLKDQYNFSFEPETYFNRLEGPQDTRIYLSPQDVQNVFRSSKSGQKVVTLNQNGKVTMVLIQGEAESNDDFETDFESSKQAIRGILAQKLQESVIESIEERTKVRVWTNRVF